MTDLGTGLPYLIAALVLGAIVVGVIFRLTSDGKLYLPSVGISAIFVFALVYLLKVFHVSKESAQHLLIPSALFIFGLAGSLVVPRAFWVFPAGNLIGFLLLMGFSKPDPFLLFAFAFAIAASVFPLGGALFGWSIRKLSKWLETRYQKRRAEQRL